MDSQHSIPYLLRRLCSEMFLNPWLTFWAIVSILLGIAASLAQPLLIRSLINTGIANGDKQVITEMAVAIAITALVSAIMAYVRSVTTQQVGEAVTYRLRNQVFRHLEAMAYSFYDTEQTGQLLSRLTEDIRNIRRFYSPALRTLIQTFILVLGSAVIMLRLNWQLGLAALTIVPLLLGITLVFGAKVRPLYLMSQRQFGDAMNVLQENLAGMRLVRAFGREAYESRKFLDEGEELYERQLDAARLAVTANATLPLVTGLGTAAVIGIGGWQVLHHSLQVGTLLAFYLYMTQITDPIRQIGPIVTNVALALASTERIFEVLERKPRIFSPPNAYRPADVRGHVTFDDVTFAYRRGGRPVLRDITIDAPPGSVTGLVGTTGSGKSSIVQLLARFYDVRGGRVLVDGVDVREWDLEVLRRNIGFVLQETFLFSDRIRDNIAYGRPDATLDEIVAAAKAAQAHEFISRLPDGYDTLLGERGVNLSGGQKQRVAIARALLLNPRILVLDEATSSVDMETEAEIQQALTTLMAGRTTFIIAQRFSSVRNANQICVLFDGQITERGTHTELLLLDGAYRQTYDVQTRDAATGGVA